MKHCKNSLSILLEHVTEACEPSSDFVVVQGTNEPVNDLGNTFHDIIKILAVVEVEALIEKVCFQPAGIVIFLVEVETIADGLSPL